MKRVPRSRLRRGGDGHCTHGQHLSEALFVEFEIERPPHFGAFDYRACNAPAPPKRETLITDAAPERGLTKLGRALHPERAGSELAGIWCRLKVPEIEVLVTSTSVRIQLVRIANVVF